jgi:hypothetical protein
MNKDSELKLIYVLKIGYNSKNEGLYEFIFSKDETNIDIELWGWDLNPAVDHAEPPTEEFIDAIYSLKTKSFDLICLHEAVDREYMHGYHNIHALAYETELEIENNNPDGFDTYDNLFDDKDDLPLLVFHYGMTLKEVKDILYGRKIILQGTNFIESSSADIN